MSTTAGIWSYWATSTCASTATIRTEPIHVTSSGEIWSNWTASGGTTASNYTDAVCDCTDNIIWYTWSEQDEHEPQQELRAERAQREIEQAWNRHTADEHAKAKELAEQKAKELLLDLIGEDELNVYEETGRLFVRGNKHDYILRKGGLVQRIEKDKVIDMCVHLENKYKYPETDNIVSLKLLLENDEDFVLEKANHRTPMNRPVELERAACM